MNQRSLNKIYRNANEKDVHQKLSDVIAKVIPNAIKLR